MSALKRARLPSTRYLASVGSEALYKRAKMEGALKAPPTIGIQMYKTVPDDAGAGSASAGNAEVQSAISRSDESDLDDSEDAWQESGSGIDEEESDYGTPPSDSPSPKGKASKSSTPAKKTSSKAPKKSPSTPRQRAQVWTSEEDRVFLDVFLEMRMPWAAIEEKLRAIQKKRGGSIKSRQDIRNHYRFIRKHLEGIAGPAPP